MYLHFNIHVLILFHQDPAPVGVIHQFPTESPWDSHRILFIKPVSSPRPGVSCDDPWAVVG